jgi:VanZ family protein
MLGKSGNASQTGRAAGLAKEYFPIPFIAGAAAYCGLIFFLSSMSSFSAASPFEHFDKVAHFFMFGGLGAIVAAGLGSAAREYSMAMRVIAPAIFCTAYGLSDEIHQLFVEHRTFEVSDMAADAMGAAFAAGLVVYLSSLWERKKDSR